MSSFILVYFGLKVNFGYFQYTPTTTLHYLETMSLFQGICIGRASWDDGHVYALVKIMTVDHGGLVSKNL